LTTSPHLPLSLTACPSSACPAYCEQETAYNKKKSVIRVSHRGEKEQGMGCRGERAHYGE
jgi:hypothetical protein